MKKWTIRLGIAIAIFTVGYIGSLGYFYWNWMVPKTALPNNTSAMGEHKIYQPTDQSQVETIEKLISEKVRDWSVPSLSIAVGLEGELAFAIARGYADIENQVAASVEHRYRIGSISKSLTALGLAKQVASGQIDLDVPIPNYIKNLPEHYQSVTPRMLGNHTAGVRHYDLDFGMWPPHEFFINDNYSSVAEGLNVFINEPLAFEPGSGFRYSSYGYNLLSAAMEAAADQNYIKLMDDTVFKPLTMVTTGIEGDEFRDSDVKYYISGGGQFAPAYSIDLSLKWASGGFVSTPSELVKAGNALLNHKFLSPANKALLLTPVANKANGQEPNGYALGWEVLETDAIIEGQATKVIFHSGGSVGGTSFLMVVPDYQITVALQSNTSGSGDGPYLRDLANELISMLVNQRLSDMQVGS